MNYIGERKNEDCEEKEGHKIYQKYFFSYLNVYTDRNPTHETKGINLKKNKE